MAKWNPTSRVNSNHLLNILVKGDHYYRSYIAGLLESFDGEDREKVHYNLEEGIKEGYLPEDTMEVLWPAKKEEQVAMAAASNAVAGMLDSLWALGQQDLIGSMILAGTVTQEAADEAAIRNTAG